MTHTRSAHTWITNAFSLNMLGSIESASLTVRRIGLDEARDLATHAVSAVGHADTASVFSDVLGMPIKHARVTLTLETSDRMLVGQYIGPRLVPGATRLPDGARIDWFDVQLGPEVA